MSDRPIIEVENLGKRYRLGAAGQRNERYTALRDVLAAKVRGLLPRRRSRDGTAPAAAVDDQDFWALKDVSFKVRPGEVVGIIGRNGAGKSTLLKILSRITEPTEGRITLRGRVASLLEVGTGFHPELTGRENIYLNGAVLGMQRAEIRRKFDEIVAFAEVDRFLDTPVKRYSSGMYVRLAFAVAAHLEPEILIVDEVLAVGDAEFQKKCLGKMDQVAKNEGRTVLFVSHNMGAVRSLCKSGILLRLGHVVRYDEISGVLNEYSGQFLNQGEATYATDPLKPCIVGVTIDSGELSKGNVVVDIEFVSPFPLRPAVPGIVISTLGGVPIFGSNTRFHTNPSLNCIGNSGALRMRADGLPLRPGHYRISAWLGDWHTDYDQKLEALTFEFGLEQPDALAPSSEAIGNLRWPATWDHSPN